MLHVLDGRGYKDVIIVLKKSLKWIPVLGWVRCGSVTFPVLTVLKGDDMV